KKPLASNSLEQQILTLERQRRELLEVNKQWDHQFRSMKQLYEKQVTMLTTSVAICVPPADSQVYTEVLSEALHELKEENRLLKQKNASMTRRKEYYESEISRLNKVGAGVTLPLHPPSSEQRGNGTKMLLYAPSKRLWLKRKVPQLRNSFFVYSVFENDGFSSEDMVLSWCLNPYTHIFIPIILCVYMFH
uniref:Uncharacterized protein n=1 Tax=Geospiza parvula TaxID=87175 RepID=A0A8C3M882_GEOPR